MNEWGFIGKDVLVGIAKSDAINKFKQRCGLVVKERTLLSKLKEGEREPGFSYFLPATLQLKYARKTKPTIFSNNEVGFRIIIME